jgi:hypothetical protein
MSRQYTYRPITTNGLIQFSEIVNGYLTPMSRSGGLVHWNPDSNTLDPRVGRTVHCEQWLVFAARQDLRFRVFVGMSDYMAFAEWLRLVGPRSIARQDGRYADLGLGRFDNGYPRTPEIAALHEAGQHGVNVLLAQRNKRLHWQQRISSSPSIPWPLTNVELVPWRKSETRPRAKAKP